MFTATKVGRQRQMGGFFVNIEETFLMNSRPFIIVPAIKGHKKFIDFSKLT